MRWFAWILAYLCATCTLGADALRNAAEALDREDYAAAIPHLEEALDGDPANDNARFNLAYAYQSQGDQQNAIRHYRVVAERQPDLLAARQNLAGLLMSGGQFEEAAEHFQAIAGARPGDTQVLRMLAVAYMQASDAGAAARTYRQILEIEPGSPETLLGMAQALDGAGRLTDAVPYYLRAGARDPKLHELLPAIAARLEQSGARQDALELFRRWARFRPNDATVQEELGIRLLEDGNLRAATAALERSVEIAPSGQRHAALAEVYRRAGDADAAHTQLRLAAESAPTDAGVRLRYANSLLQRREFEQAVREYLSACEADAGQRDAWNGLAFAIFQMGNYPAVLRAIEESDKLGPPQAATVYLEALAWDKLQQYEQAQSAYREFVALDPDMQDEVWKAEQRLKTIEKVLSKR